MRLRLASLSASAKLSKERVTPGSTSEVTTKLNGLRPKTALSTNSLPALIAACAPGYDGSAAVLVGCGSQFGSAAVSGLPSVAAARIAVTGRQKLYVYL